MLLILTNSLDGTSDELVRRIGSAHVFRFNVDLWRDYEIKVAPGMFRLADPSGRSLMDDQVKACYVRKPTFDDPLDIPAGGCLEEWLRRQMSYVTQEIYNLCHRRGIVRLVEKGAQQRFGKFVQMEVAGRYFRVPKWSFTNRVKNTDVSQSTVVKALTADFVENYRFLYTTRAAINQLDPQYPWLLQEEIAADFDLTVVYVEGRCFGFVLPRDFEGVDWRRHINKKDLPWARDPLSADLEERIRCFMAEANLTFGRLDFLLHGGEVEFLEVNPNGQWAWLDLDGSEGIFECVKAVLTDGWLAPASL